VWCDAAQQYLNAGLVDEMQLHLAPTLLGDGERLFDTVHDLHGLALVETVAAKKVTHLDSPENKSDAHLPTLRSPAIFARLQPDDSSFARAT
jgi:riboflavin biosynthesis pyrimidine reductase